MKNKVIIIFVGILLFIALVCLLFWGHKKYMNSIYRPGPDKISTQKTAIVFHPYNEGIKQVANVIGSDVKADVYRLEPDIPYPESAELTKERMINEYTHPEKVVLKANNFDIKKYHIIFIGVPIIYNKTSPLVMRFVLDIENSLNKDKIIIPFVYYQGKDNPSDAYKFLYAHTRAGIYKNGYTSSINNIGSNKMEISMWLKDMYFKRNEIKHVKKSDKTK